MINRKEIERLIAMELEDANKKHHPLFASDHESYAVIKEELEETEAELKHLFLYLSSVWHQVKNDTKPTRDYCGMKCAAIRMIQEGIQVAAMCEKAQKVK